MIYLGPFLFAYSPALLLNGGPGQVFMTYLTCALGTITFSALTMGYLVCPTNIAEWIVAAIGTVLLLFPQIIYKGLALNIPPLAVDLIAIALFVLVYMSQKYRIRKNPDLTLPLHERMKLREATA